MTDFGFELHELFNGLKRYSYPFDQYIADIPQNGVYIKFETGERYKDYDRIVRVGTDTGENQLRSRLFQHYEHENQRRSIFRKNIGRCILAKNNDKYLNFWNLEFTSKADKDRNSKYIDLDYEKVIEKEISEYIKSNISFCFFQVDDKVERLFWETKIIATLAQSNINPSVNWLGNHSPKKRIKTTGLWQIQGVTKPKLTRMEYEQLHNLIKQ